MGIMGEGRDGVKCNSCFGVRKQYQPAAIHTAATTIYRGGDFWVKIQAAPFFVILTPAY
jgi:hypothetical protein